MYHFFLRAHDCPFYPSRYPIARSNPFPLARCPHTKVLIVYHNKFNTFYGTWYFSYKALNFTNKQGPLPPCK